MQQDIFKNISENVSWDLIRSDIAKMIKENTKKEIPSINVCGSEIISGHQAAIMALLAVLGCSREVYPITQFR